MTEEQFDALVDLIEAIVQIHSSKSPNAYALRRIEAIDAAREVLVQDER
jgi:hypothetical protein